MYKSFRIIYDLIRDIYGFHFLKEPMDARIAETGIQELNNAYDTMISIIHDKRKPFSQEFVRNVYPLLEIAIHWNKLKNFNKLTDEFLAHSRNRMQKMQNFYGTIFELDMASRCLLSNWRIDFIEDTTKRGEPQIDFIFYTENRVIGIDCMSKRLSGIYTPENLTIDKINNDIHNHAQKFKPEYISNLGIVLNEKLLIMDITRKDYQHPELVSSLKDTQMPSELDGVVYTWREDFADGENHSLIVKYCIIGSLDRMYFSTTYAAEFRPSAFFMRKYVYPEPRVGTPGPEETIEDYYRKQKQ